MDNDNNQPVVSNDQGGATTTLPLRKPDIKYRGPLSYRWLRIIGWLAFAVSQIAAIIGVATNLGAATGDTTIAQNILSSFGTLMMPLFLLANFALILQSRRSYKFILTIHGGLTVIIILLYYLIVERYMLAIFNLITDDKQTSRDLVVTVFEDMFSRGINVFLDLFLCSSFAFFMNYEPKRFFQGKWIYLFRCLVLLPIAYEVTFHVLKLIAINGDFYFNSWLVPWMTSKPLSVFIGFASIIIILKLREFIWTKRGNTQEEIEAFEATNHNSLRVSIIISIVFAIVGVISFFAWIVVARFYLPPDASEDLTTLVLTELYSVGYGQGATLILAIPFTLLFSYSREHKNKLLDRLVPLGGIFVTMVVFIEGVYWILTHLPKS